MFEIHCLVTCAVQKKAIQKEFPFYNFLRPLHPLLKSSWTRVVMFHYLQLFLDIYMSRQLMTLFIHISKINMRFFPLSGMAGPLPSCYGHRSRISKVKQVLFRDYIHNPSWVSVNAMAYKRIQPSSFKEARQTKERVWHSITGFHSA